MRKSKILRAVAAFSVLAITSTANVARAGASFSDTFAIINNGGGDYYYKMVGSSTNTALSSLNMNINLLGGTLVLNGGQNKVTVTSPDYQKSWNVQNQNYRFYLSGASAPSFSQFNNFSWSGDTYPTYTWQTNSAGINLLSGKDSGTYKLDMSSYGQATYWNGSADTGYYMSDSATYTATFNLYYGATAAGTQSSAFTGSGFFNLNASGATYTLDKTNTYTGETQIDAGTLAISGSLSSSSAVYLGSGTNGANAAVSLSGTTTLSNNITVNPSTGSGTRTISKTDATAQTMSGSLTLNREAAVSVDNAAGSLTFSGVVGGTNALTKSGSGTLVFSGSSANTYSGTTTVNAGVLVLNKSGNANALAGTPTINSGGTIRLGAANQFSGDTTFLTVNSGGVFDMNGYNETLAIQGAGTVSLGGGTMTINPGNVETGDNFSGVIQGATGNLIKTNVGIQTLSGSSTYDGTTTVGQGILRIANANALGSTSGATTVISGAALQLSNASSMTVAENITVNGVGVSNLNGALRNVGGSNTLSGTITLGSNSRITATAGSLSVGAVSGGNNVLFVGADGANVSISGAISGGGASQDGTTTSLFKDGANALTLSGNNSYSGDTRVSAGSLTVASGGNLGNGTSDLYIAKDGSVAINTSTTVSSIREWGTTNGGTASIGSGATLTVGGDSYEAYQNSISGSGALIKSGSGTLGLYGTQGYTGKTTVSAGLLKLQNDIVSFASTNVEVTGGTFQTQSANILGDSSAIAVSGGTLSLGANDTVGSFQIATGSLTGSGTLTASTYALNGGTVSANLGAGAATAASGTTSLNGTFDGSLTVSGGTVNLGSSDRIGNSAVTVSSGTLGMSTYTDTVSSFEISGGTLGGSGTLTASTYALKGGTVTANLGGGTATAASGTTSLNGALGATTFNVSGGTVNLGSNDRLANGATVTVSGGALGMGGNTDTIGTLNVSGGSVTGSTGNKLTAGTYNLTGGTVGANLGTGTLNANSGSATLNGTADATTINVGGGSLGLGSAGRLASGAAVTISNSGTLTLGGSETISSLAGNGGTLALGANTLSVGSGSFGSTITGSGILTKTGALTLTLSGNNSYSGGTLLNGGWLTAGHASAFGTGSITVGSGTTLNLTNFAVANTIINNGGTILSTGKVDDVVATNGTTDIGGNSSTVAEVGGSATVNVTGSSVVVSNASGGTLNADGSGIQVGTISGSAAVNVGGANGRVATMSGGTVNANASGLVVTNYSGGNIAVSNGVTVALQNGSSAGAISGSGGVAKQSASTLTLSGVNTYSGATTVEAGKLVVNGSITNSAVTVQSGATLGGGGAVGETTLLSGATVAPGNSPGTLTIEGNHTWSGGSSYDWEIYNVAGTPGSEWDLIDVSGGLLFSGLSEGNKFTINLLSLNALPSTLGTLAGWDSSLNWTWTILSAGSAIPSINASYFTLNHANFSAYNDLNGGTFSLAADGNDLNLLFTANAGPGPEPVPEPGTWAAAALLAGAAGFVRWRRRNKRQAA